MKVKELIEALKNCNQDAEVVTEGCDCYGDVAIVSKDHLKDVVFLGRSGGDADDQNTN